MMFKTHLALAFLTGLFSIEIFNPVNQILFMLLILFGGLLPDIDHPKSKIGRYFKPISFLFEHRGFFHSFLFLPILSLLIYILLKTNTFTLPILIGYSSHLISDAITKEGIMPLHPLSKFRIKGFIYTGKMLEFTLFILLLVLSVWKLFSVTM